MSKVVRVILLLNLVTICLKRLSYVENCTRFESVSRYIQWQRKCLNWAKLERKSGSYSDCKKVGEGIKFGENCGGSLFPSRISLTQALRMTQNCRCQSFHPPCTYPNSLFQDLEPGRKLFPLFLFFDCTNVISEQGETRISRTKWPRHPI